MEVANEFYLKYKKIIFTLIVAFAFTLSSVAVYSAGFNFEVTVDNNIVGYVDSELDANNAINQVLNQINDKYGNHAYIKQEIEINKVRGFSDLEVEVEVLSSELLNNVDVYNKSSVLVVDEQEVIALSNPTVAKYVLEDLLKPYANNEDGTVGDNVRFKQEINVIEKDVLVENIIDYDSALLALTPTSSNDENQIMPISMLANDNQKVRSLNSDLNEENFLSNLLDVVSEVESYDEEDVDYETVEEKDSSLYVGVKKVKQKGVVGTKEFTYVTTYVNGVENDKVKTSEEITVEPTDEIVLVGTKEYTYSNAPGASSGTIQAVIAEARKHVGVAPYVWGGRTPAGFDCSGFTHYVFKAGGVNLPHSSSAQANMGTRVAKGDLQAGDLVIFKGQTGNGVGHVGLYIGGGQMIHAPMGGHKVSIASINNSYFAPRFISGQRVK